MANASSMINKVPLLFGVSGMRHPDLSAACRSESEVLKKL